MAFTMTEEDYEKAKRKVHGPPKPPAPKPPAPKPPKPPKPKAAKPKAAKRKALKPISAKRKSRPSSLKQQIAY